MGLGGVGELSVFVCFFFMLFVIVYVYFLRARVWMWVRGGLYRRSRDAYSRVCVMMYVRDDV